MHAGMSEFVAEHMKGLTEMVTELRRSRVAAARKAAVESAARIKSLNQRVRSLARSGVRVTAASQGAVQSLIELQEDIVTSALNDAAAQMQRLAYTESVRDLARVQGEILQAARQRIVDDIARAVTVLKSAAGDVRARPRPGPSARHASPSGARVPDAEHLGRQKNVQINWVVTPVRKA